MEEEEAMDQDHGVAEAMINGEVVGDMMLDHLDHGAILQVMEVVGVEDGEMEHMVEAEKRKDFEVEEEEEEEVIHTNINVLLTPYIINNIYTI